jgi:hypothetical protein
MNQIAQVAASGRYARPGLFASCVLLVGAALLFGVHHALALIAICLVVLVRHSTRAEPATAFPTLAQILPVILVVCITFSISFLPEPYHGFAVVWILPPAVFLFLAWCVVQEVRRYRRAPRFRSFHDNARNAYPCAAANTPPRHGTCFHRHLSTRHADPAPLRRLPARKRLSTTPDALNAGRGGNMATIAELAVVRRRSTLAMKRTSLLFVLLLTVFIGGCFYEAPVSLTPSQEIDHRVLGPWESGEGREGRETNKLQITEADAHHYTISFRWAKGGLIDLGQMDFRAHHVKVAGLDIVNVQLIDPTTKKPSKWAFLSYTLPDADTIHVRLINKGVFPLSPSTQGNPGSDRILTADAMRKHIESVAQRPDLFSGGEMLLTRTKK